MLLRACIALAICVMHAQAFIAAPKLAAGSANRSKLQLHSTLDDFTSAAASEVLARHAQSIATNT
jgi:hypothetical protein